MFVSATVTSVSTENELINHISLLNKTIQTYKIENELLINNNNNNIIKIKSNITIIINDLMKCLAIKEISLITLKTFENYLIKYNSNNNNNNINMDSNVDSGYPYGLKGKSDITSVIQVS